MTSKLFKTKIRKPRQRQWWQPCCRPASTTPTPSTSASRASSSAAPAIRTSSVLSWFYSLFQSCHHFVLLPSPVIILSSIMALFSHYWSEHIHFFHPSTEFPIVHNHLQQIFSILFVLWFRFTSFLSQFVRWSPHHHYTIPDELGCPFPLIWDHLPSQSHCIPTICVMVSSAYIGVINRKANMTSHQ